MTANTPVSLLRHMDGSPVRRRRSTQRDIGRHVADCFARCSCDPWLHVTAEGVAVLHDPWCVRLAGLKAGLN